MPVARPAQTGAAWETFSQIAVRFESESRDPTWSAAAEARIFGKISAITDLTVVSLDVDCRTTMCRVRVVQNDMSSTSMRALAITIGTPSWLLQNPSDPTQQIVWLPQLPLVIRGTPEASTYLGRDVVGLEQASD